MLLATGRKPNTEGLNTEAAGIKLSNRGAILVDEHLRTNVPGIWAMGDVTGGLQFTYISLDDYRVIKDELFGKGTRTKDDRRGVAYSVFIDPPLSRIGMGEEEALNSGEILGCTLFCAESTEVINLVSLAIRAGKDYTFLRDSIYTHPSMSESLNDLFALIKQ